MRCGFNSLDNKGDMKYPMEASEKLAASPWFQLLQEREQEAGQG